MQTLPRKTLTTLALAAALLGSATAASAQEPLMQRLATGVGQIIAAQGNAALSDIRDELRDSFKRSVEPLLPRDAAPAPEPLAPDTAIEVRPARRLTL